MDLASSVHLLGRAAQYAATTACAIVRHRLHAMDQGRGLDYLSERRCVADHGYQISFTEKQKIDSTSIDLLQHLAIFIIKVLTKSIIGF